MLPQFYQTHLQQHLTQTQFLVLSLLLNVLQSSKQVKLELEFRLRRSKSVIAVRLANSSQERQRSATSYQTQP